MTIMNFPWQLCSPSRYLSIPQLPQLHPLPPKADDSAAAEAEAPEAEAAEAEVAAEEK